MMIIRETQMAEMARANREAAERRVVEYLNNIRGAGTATLTDLAHRTVLGAERFGIVHENLLLRFALLISRFGERFERYPAPELAYKTLECPGLDEESKIRAVELFADLMSAKGA